MELKSIQSSSTAKLPLLKQVAETSTDDAGTSTGPITIEEKAKKKNDVKARSMFLMALPNEHLMTFNQYKDAKTFFAAIETRFANQPNGSQLMHEDLEQIHEDDIEKMDLKWQLALLRCFNCHKMGHFAREYRVPRNQENMTRNQETTRWTVNVEDISSKAMVAIDGAAFDWGYTAEDEAPTNMAFMALSDSEYLEKISNEKDALQTKIEKFKNASQSLDKLIESQVTDNSKKGLGYVRYNAVPPPHTRSYSPPRIDLSHTGLPEFAEPSVQSYRVKPFEVDRESDEEDEVESPLEKERKSFEPIMDKVEVEIPKQNDKPVRRLVKYVEMYRTQRTRGNQRNWNNLKSHQLADESHVLLKFPRKNNMYSVYIKNIVPKKDLTCIIAKATHDESMLWNMRLGHINFKNNNKLVKDNLVRGLPSKHFENDQTCVACLKGKQHKVSFKSKIQNSISQPLFMLHMDLFGPTSVSSIMHKKSCFVITDDFSRFTWVFFLATNDETCRILKSFITEIEKLVDKKVKIIRCDNGIEFKNRVMNEFCEEKSIKREYNVARTPQQNGAAKRRNKTLIEASRTMVLVVKPHFKTPYELFRGRTPALSFIRPFGCHDNNGPNTESEIDNQHRPNGEYSTKEINTIQPSINTDSLNINTASPTVNIVRLSDDFFGADNDMSRFFVYHMDVKSAFLYGKIEEEVYVCQPPGFEDPDYPDKVYKVEKALNGLHQAPSAWYETLAKYLLGNGFCRGKIDQTLFIERQKDDIPLVQVYVNDIIFGSTKKELCTEFEVLMHGKF
nr:putative ribonuclease H-like domain-containing protein [Tanacetum cinerariifolium]